MVKRHLLSTHKMQGYRIKERFSKKYFKLLCFNTSGGEKEKRWQVVQIPEKIEY